MINLVKGTSKPAVKTYKVYWREYMNSVKTGDNLIKATSEEEAIREFENSYPINVITSIVDCSSSEYQSAYDAEQFDSNGRRRF